MILSKKLLLAFLITSLVGSFAVNSVRAADQSLPEEQHWCEQSDGHTAVCVGGVVIGLLVLLGLGEADPDQPMAQEKPDPNDPSGRDMEHQQDRAGADIGSSFSGAKPDTSVGCAWGDRAYGNCH